MFMFMGAMTTAAADLQKRVDEIMRGLATPVRGSEVDFGQRIKQSVMQRAHNRFAGFVATASAHTGEGFGEQLKKAVQRRSSAMRRQQQCRVSADAKKIAIAAELWRLSYDQHKK